jgi:hypothetical protein
LSPKRIEMYNNGGGFYNPYHMSEETAPRPAPAPRREESQRTAPRQAPYQPRPITTIAPPSSSTGNGALVAQLGILAVIALFMFMKLNSS